MKQNTWEDKYNQVKSGNGGFDDMTVARTIALMLNSMRVPTLESGGMIRFKPMGASSFGGYIYKSGVIMIFNEHLAPFESNKVSLKEVLKTLMHKSNFGFMALLKKIEIDRAMWLMETGKTYDEVFGFEGYDVDLKASQKPMVRSQSIPDDEVKSYTEIIVPIRDSVFQKFDETETTVWEIANIITGCGRGGKELENKTRTCRKANEKLGLPVIFTNFHYMTDIEGKRLVIPNRCVTLDFDLAKQGFDFEKCKRIRDTVSCMAETILVAESFTKGNFWALMAAGEFGSYKKFSEETCFEVEQRLSEFAVVLDKTSCRIKQPRFVSHDKHAIVKFPSRRFFEFNG